MSPTSTAVPPLSLRVRIYNSAGELVWEAPTDLRVAEAPLSLRLIEPVAAPEAGQPAVVAIAGPGYVLQWDGRGLGGQAVDGGAYTLVVEARDKFNAVSTLSATLTVLRAPSGADIAVYNSAGELVRTHHGASSGDGRLSLDKEGISPGEGQGQGVELRWGPGAGEAWVWDGTDEQGQAVASGSYTVQIVRREQGKSTGSQTVAVTVLAQPASGWLEGAAAAPNPARGAAPRILFAAPKLPLGARLSADVYNVAGELVAHLSGTTPSLALDLGARPLAGGVYLARLRAAGADGREETRVLKIAVVR